MLKFELHGDDRATVNVNPLGVNSIEETEVRAAYGGWQKVAVLRMGDGSKFVVEDGGRRVAEQINEAQLREVAE